MRLALALVVVLVNVCLIALTLGGPSVSPPLPNPNACDDSVKVAGLLTGDVANTYTLIRSRKRPICGVEIGASTVSPCNW
jgi:hypothetical protein